jgi:hypothetical protein
MENSELINVLELARIELESCYQKLGYNGSNVLTQVNETIEKLNFGFNVSITPYKKCPYCNSINVTKLITLDSYLDVCKDCNKPF